jgi:hypothetical protein
VSVAAGGVAASLAAGTVSVAVATAIGSGVVSAGLSLAQGASVSQALKGAVIGGVTSFVGASVAGEVTKSITTAAAGSAATSSIAASLGKVAGAMAGGGTQAALGSVLSGKGDPIKALIAGGLTAGLTSGAMLGANEITSRIPGFNDLGKDYGAAGVATQRAVNAGLAAGVLGKDTDKAVVNSVLSSMLGAGKDYVKAGIKDVSDTLQTAYDNAIKTGESVDSNIARQNEIVKDYTTTADDIEAKRQRIQADLDKYNENKDGYDNYDQKLASLGYERKSEDQYDGPRLEYWENAQGDREPPSRDTFLAEANKYATKVNDAIPGYEEERAAVEAKLGTLSTELDELKTQIPTLEETLVTQKATLDTSIADFQKQEEENAQYVAKVFNDTVAAKTEVEQALGAPLGQEQLDAFLTTGDVAAAAKDYIDIKTTDLAEAQAAALKEGYRFDPNDPELAQFFGVKDEAATLAALQTFADARATTMQEATDMYTQTYADIYGPDVAAPPPTEEDLLAFMPAIPTDVSGIPDNYQGVAEDVVRGRIQDQFSQNLGFEDYQDRSFAQESLGQERPDAGYWGQFKDTSGVVGVGGSDVAPVQFGATDEASTFIPQAEENDLFNQNTYAASDYGPFLPDDPRSDANQFGFDTPAQTDSNQFGFDQPFIDMADLPTPADLGVGNIGIDTADMGDVPADIPGVQTAAIESPTITETALPDTQLSTAPTDLMEPDFGVANAPVDTSTVSGVLDYGQDRGVQTAAFQPSNVMSDTEDMGDVGLRSLVTTQQGGTSGTADDSGIASLTDRNLTETTKPDLEAATKGTATYSALTDADPTKTIGTSILDDESGDVRGGIQSNTLYSGADNEFGASDTLTSKYLRDDDAATQDVEDVGLASRTGTGNDTTTFAESNATEQALQGDDDLNQFVSPLVTEKTTLPVSQEPARVTPNLGNNMEDDFDYSRFYDIGYEGRGADNFDAISQEDADIGRAMLESMGGGVENLRTPDGVDESFLDRLTPAERERYLAMQDPNYQNPLVDLAPQDLGISQENIDSFNQNFNPEGGFSSGWQNVGTNKVFIHDDGTASVLDPTTGESSYLTEEQVVALISNGTLNSAKSGYVAATGGTGNTPGGSGPAKTGGTTPKGTGANSTTDRIAGAITNALTNSKTLAVLAGGALGAAGGAKGMEPRGLRSVATGTSGQRVQTGAKGTGGKGTVKYFERKAAGGAIDGYAKGGGLGYLKSAHDGMEDKIDATIDNKRPAKLSGGEFVVPADVVSHLGNGNSEAGAKQLYALMERVRKARTGTADQGKQINPKKYLPK